MSLGIRLGSCIIPAAAPEQPAGQTRRKQDRRPSEQRNLAPKLQTPALDGPGQEPIRASDPFRRSRIRVRWGVFHVRRPADYRKRAAWPMCAPGWKGRRSPKRALSWPKAIIARPDVLAATSAGD